MNNVRQTNVYPLGRMIWSDMACFLLELTAYANAQTGANAIAPIPGSSASKGRGNGTRSGGYREFGIAAKLDR